MELTSENLHILVESFYSRVWKDDLIGPKFAHVDFDMHLPKMVNFWSTVIFSAGTYTGQPFDKHVAIGLEKEHFERWLSLFEATVHEHFEGEMAEEIIKRAGSIASIFQHKLKSLDLLS